jgi:hypothetical protein
MHIMAAVFDGLELLSLLSIFINHFFTPARLLRVPQTDIMAAVFGGLELFLSPFLPSVYFYN